MEPIAIEWGIPANEFWAMTYDEIVKQITANKKRYELEMKNHAMFDYTAAQLHAYAVNKPEKMPTAENAYPFLKSEEEQIPISEQPYNMEKDRAILLNSLLGLQQHLNKKTTVENTENS